MKLTIINLAVILLSFMICKDGYSQNNPTASTASTTSGDKTFASKGIFEIGGNASYASITEVVEGQTLSGSFSILNLSPQFGYFVTNGLEIGFNTGVTFFPGIVPGGITYLSDGQNSNTTILQLFATLSYNFKTKGESVYPFLEGQIGYSSESESGGTASSGLGWGLRGGIKVVATSHLLFTFSAQYLALTLNQPNDPLRNGFNYFSVGVGIGGFL